MVSIPSDRVLVSIQEAGYETLEGFIVSIPSDRVLVSIQFSPNEFGHAAAGLVSIPSDRVLVSIAAVPFNGEEMRKLGLNPLRSGLGFNLKLI